MTPMTHHRPPPPIHALIGVWHDGAKTFYVKRSPKMGNYPSVWSLLSIQFDPAGITDPLNLGSVRSYMKDMTHQRLGPVPIHVKRYLSSATCSDNPMRTRVFLYMYEVSFDRDPPLNPDYYTDSAWMTPAEYEAKSTGSTCGLCLRMWSDYCVRQGLAETGFAPALAGRLICPLGARTTYGCGWLLGGRRHRRLSSSCNP